MLVMVLAAGAILMGVPSVVVIGAVVLSLLPVPVALAGAAVAAVGLALHKRAQSDRESDEGELLRQFSGRVSAGATIRSTIADPTIKDVPDHARRLATLGQPMADVGDALASVFPVNGAAFRAICSFSEHTGAAISAALGVLADLADEATELARQRKVSLAQVKLSAIVVGIVPMAASIGLIAVRGIPDPGGAVIVVSMMVGVGLQVIGTAIVFKVASGANR
jgi:Flp pilus assembly protein TadB